MFNTVTLVAALALVALLPASNAFFEQLSPQMTGGSVVSDVSTYSFQAAIRPTRTQGGTTVKLSTCSGVIIKGVNSSALETYFVLTSASCALSGTSLDIFIGTNQVVATTAADLTVDTSSVIINPEYLNTNEAGDLAVIPDDAARTIETAVTSGTVSKMVTAALLPNLSDAAKGYLLSSVTMSGWGFPNDVYQANSPKLRALKSRVVLNTYCKLAHFGKPITGKHLCTGGLINKGPCTGDSGAPLMVTSDSSRRVIGLATLTPSNGCSKGKPGIFTSLGQYLDWIVEVTNYDPEQ